VVSATDPHCRTLGFLDAKPLLFYPHEAEWNPFQTHYFSKNLVEPGFEPRTTGSVARNSGLIADESHGV
jgi:hypothetical protein